MTIKVNDFKTQCNFVRHVDILILFQINNTFVVESSKKMKVKTYIPPARTWLEDTKEYCWNYS